VERKWWTLLAVCVGTFMLLLDVTIVTVALPDIQHGLNASFGDLQWVADAYALSLASFLLTTGVLADMYGRRMIFSVGLVIFTLGSLLCGVAQSPVMLIVSRAAQGIGGSMMFATSLALLAHSFRGKERAVAFGAWGAVTGIATGVGPVLGGILTTDVSWRSIFLVNLPVGVIALGVTLWRVEESRAEHRPTPDWPGFVTLTVGLVGVVYGLIRASEIDWSDAGVIISLVVGGLSVLAFVVVEAKVEHPLFDLSLFRIPTFLGGSIAAFGMNGSLYALFLYLVLYLQDILGFSALQTGLRLLVVSGATFVAASLSGRFSSRLPVRWMIGVGLLMVGGGLWWMSGLTASSGWTALVPGFILGGIGSGLVNPPLASTAVGVVPHQKSGMASGVNSTFRQIGIAAGIAVFGTLFTARLGAQLHSNLAAVPGLAGRSDQIFASIRSGEIGQVLSSAPPAERGALAHAATASFVSGLNEILIVGGALAVVAGIASLLLIRGQDFVASHPQPDTAQSQVVASAAD
jgi:EmrB/QacA subfamily drug resistance transporter